MFEKQYIEDLIRGKLSADGYKSILKSICAACSDFDFLQIQMNNFYKAAT